MTRTNFPKAALLITLPHLVLAALAVLVATDRFASPAASAADLPEPLAASVEPMFLDLPPVAAAPKAAPHRASVRVSAVKVDARALATAALDGVAAPALTGHGLAGVALDRAEGAEAFVPREAPPAEAVSEHLVAVLTQGRAGGNADYGNGWGMAHVSKPSPMLALADR